MNPAFWSGKTVLITGHTGFKGSWLALWLQKLNVNVIGYALSAPTSPSLFEVAEVSKNMRSVVGDVRDVDSLKALIKEHNPDIVIHLAAQALVRHSYEFPVETFATNVMGTVNVLEAVRASSTVRAVLVITSDKCYENKEWVWGYRESDAMGGYDPYSSSKGCAELVIAAYRNSFFKEAGIALASARAGNVIGGGDWARDRLIPDIVRSFMDSEVVTIRNPPSIRPWQHVLEPLHGYMVLLKHMVEHGESFSEGWNFGPDMGDAKPVSWIADQLAGLWGGDAQWKQDDSQHPHEAHCLRLDTSKARSLLGWGPQLRLSTALEWVVEWYRDFHQGINMRAITEAQIDRFQAGCEQQQNADKNI